MATAPPAAASRAARASRSSLQTPLTVTTVTGSAALELLDDRWDELLGLQLLPNPTLSSTWLGQLARWQAGEPLVAVAEADGRLVGGAAFELRRRGGSLGVWVAGWLGPAEQLCSPDLLVHPAHPEAAEAIVAAVLAVGDAVALAAPAAGPTARALRVVAPWSRAEELGRRWTLPWPPPLSLIHISEPTRRTPISYAVFCLKKKKTPTFSTRKYKKPQWTFSSTDSNKQ